MKESIFTVFSSFISLEKTTEREKKKVKIIVKPLEPSIHLESKTNKWKKNVIFSDKK